MTATIWLAVIIMTIEAVVSGSGPALVLGLCLAFVGIYLEGRKSDVV